MCGSGNSCVSDASSRLRSRPNLIGSSELLLFHQLSPGSVACLGPSFCPVATPAGIACIPPSSGRLPLRRPDRRPDQGQEPTAHPHDSAALRSRGGTAMAPLGVISPDPRERGCLPRHERRPTASLNQARVSIPTRLRWLPLSIGEAPDFRHRARVREPRSAATRRDDSRLGFNRGASRRSSQTKGRSP